MKKSTQIIFITLVLILNGVYCQPITAQWIPTGPEGGFIKCMTRSDNYLYAVSGFYWFASPELYSSSDEGNTWTRINSVTLPTDIRDIESLGNSLFVGTGSGIYRSDDGGITWEVKNNGFPIGDKWINHVAISGNTIFAAGTSSGMLRSLDNGENWTVATTGLTDTYIYSLTANESAVFAGTGDNYRGVFRSTDNGNTWQQVKNGMGYYYNGNWNYSEAPMIASLNFAGDVLYAGTSEFQGIWKSADFGDNWVFTSMETMNYAEITAITGNESVVLAGSSGGEGVIRSTNGGVTWSGANNGIGNYGQVSTFFNTAANTFVGTKGGIYKTNDNGIHWLSVNNGIYSQNISSHAFAVIGSELFLGTEHGGVFKSEDQGSSWIESNNGLPINTWNLGNIFSTSTALFAWDRVSLDGGSSWEMAINYSPGAVGPDYNGPRWLEHGGAWFAINWNESSAGMYRSIDNGQHWSLLTNGLPNPVTTRFVQLSSDDTNLILSTEGGVYYSADNGDNWSLSVFDPPVSFGMNTSAGAAFNAGNSTLVMTPGGLYNSTNHGASWNLLHFWGPITDYAVSYKQYYKSGNIIYAHGEYSYWDNQAGRVYVNNFYMSPDEGITWTNITDGFPAINSITFAYEGPNIYIIGKLNNEWDIYRSSDQGTTWVNVSQSFTNARVTQLFIHGDQIFAGTNGNSVWKRNLDEFSAPDQPGAITGNGTPCSGSAETYSVENVAGVTYNWQVPADWVILSGNGSYTVSVQVGSQAGLVLVTPNNVFGSGPSQFLLVEPSQQVLPAISIETSQNEVCEGDLIVFSSTASNTGDQPEYSWLVNENEIGETQSTLEYSPLNGDVVSLMLMSSLGCTTQNPVFSNSITVIVKEAPQVSWSGLEQDTLCINHEPVLLAGGEPFGGSFYGVGVTDNMFYPAVAGHGSHSLTYSYTNQEGCTNQAGFTITVALCADLAEKNPEFLIYPNPAADVIYIKLPEGFPINEIEITNVFGSPVFGEKLSQGNGVFTISVQDFPTGIYAIRIKSPNEIITKSIIIK